MSQEISISSLKQLVASHFDRQESFNMKRARLGDEESANDEERASSRIRRSSGDTLGDAGGLSAITTATATAPVELSVTLQAPHADSAAMFSNSDEDIQRDSCDNGSEEAQNDSDILEDTEPWGFVVYRTTYGEEEKWKRFRRALDDFIEGASESIHSEGADPQAVVLEFVEDEATLKDATSQQIRLMFNPKYRDISNEEDAESNSSPPPPRDDGLCDLACLMIDETSMDSVLNHTKESPGYVIAVDADSEKSEQWISKPDGGEDDHEVIRCEYDGTMKVHVEDFLTEFYLRSIKDGALIMGEIHGSPNRIWSAAWGLAED